MFIGHYSNLVAGSLDGMQCCMSHDQCSMHAWVCDDIAGSGVIHDHHDHHDGDWVDLKLAQGLSRALVSTAQQLTCEPTRSH